ncbi:MAG: glycosyl hydrolase [Tannerella sp.]|jgi:hypothetical protein|nr:glycosyl hydrolase [Tannerella sp.]
MKKFFYIGAVMGVLLCGCSGSIPTDYTALSQGFIYPPDTARAGVYWYFMDGNVSAAGITKDLEAMQQAGIGYVVYLEVNVGVPRGKVDFLSDEWQDLFSHALHECERLGIRMILGIGPGWTGSGGPWVEADESMQHLVSTRTEITGGGQRKVVMPQPHPKRPFFGESSFTPEAKHQWETYYRDVATLAFPAGTATFGSELSTEKAYFPVTAIEEKALYYRKPYSSAEGVKQYLPSKAAYNEPLKRVVVQTSQIIDLTALLQPDGTIEWDAPEGEWTVMRFGAVNNGAATRPAPLPGVGLEVDKFDTTALNHHFENFTSRLFRRSGFEHKKETGGLITLHIDSWEMGAQNWTQHFREEFMRRRHYDPLPFYPVYDGQVINSIEQSERFLWDVRRTAQELVIENHVGHVRKYAQGYGLNVSIEPYDMNPVADLELAVAADMPMAEFWSLGEGYNTGFSAIEGSSAAHLLGQPVVPAEAFTAHLDGWRQHPASMKNQTDWAFAAGINRLMYHTFQHQPLPDSQRPGMTMGPYGVHWDRNQTWWSMAQGYHSYVARCQFMLQQGRTVADVLYLAPEGAPHVFLPPLSAIGGLEMDAANPNNFRGETPLPDRKGYSFDACPPSMLMTASVRDGQIVFASGASYRLLVLPAVETMTPELLGKVKELTEAGATVTGLPPMKSPSLTDFPACDDRVKAIADALWDEDKIDIEGITGYPTGRGRLYYGKASADIDRLYPKYEITSKILSDNGIAPDFSTVSEALRYTHRRTDDCEIYFVSNRTGEAVTTTVTFRAKGQPELWHPVTREQRALPKVDFDGEKTQIPLQFKPFESYFIVFTVKSILKTDAKSNFTDYLTVKTLNDPWEVAFDPAWGGPEKTVFDRLTDWSQNADEGIRYYSGTAVYRQTFHIEGTQSKRYALSLGKVRNMARIRLNGNDLGVVWAEPWQTEITGAIRDGDNELEIEVVNLWANRLIGDENVTSPDGKRFTFATYKHYTKDSPLLESGLLGPVTIDEIVDEQ